MDDAGEMQQTGETGERSVVLVSGGSRGIGAAVVRRCLADGWSVCFTYSRDEAGAGALLREVGDAGRLVAVRAEATDEGAMGSALDAAASLGRVSAVVNNAGTTGTLGSFVDVDPEEARRVLDVNLLAPLLLCRLALRQWTPDPVGRSIVNVSSIAAATGAPHEYIPYAAAKAGVETMTVGLATEVAPLGIRVNAVAPGTTDTGIHAAAGDPHRPQRVASRIPLGRVAEPDEIAAAVGWLLSDDASYVTGTVLRVAGGL